MKTRKKRVSQGVSGEVLASPSSKAEAVAMGETVVAKKLESLDSLAVFRLCIQRAQNLLKIHEEAHGRRSRPEKYLADAHRASLVLAISALDAYVRAFTIERVILLLERRVTALPSILLDRIKQLLKEDALLDAARKGDLSERVEKAMRMDFAKRSFQGTKAIEETLRVAGIEAVFHEVAGEAGLNEDTLKRELDEFTDRRHLIAHQGDCDLNQQPPREQTITKRSAEDCIRLVSKIAETIHRIGGR